jgi:hypothetical protein
MSRPNTLSAENPRVENSKTQNSKTQNSKTQNPRAENPKAENQNAERLTGFSVSAIPPAVLERVRARGRDDFGNRLEITINQDDGGAPLRCCLREAAVGESITLIAYQPATCGGPYAEVGPVFIHAEPCSGYPQTSAYPEGFRHRPQLFRAYGPTGRQVHNQIVEPGEQEAVIGRLLARPDVDFIHSRNLLAGCYMFSIIRSKQ